jgi:hypothetical protein
MLDEYFSASFVRVVDPETHKPGIRVCEVPPEELPRYCGASRQKEN